MERDVPDWATQAATLPVAFAQVREDALQDLRVIENLNDNARVIMVASGGCTAAALAASAKVALLHLVDPNPAQLALTKLKLNLLENSATKERLEILGHVSLPAEERAARLKPQLAELDLSEEVFGSMSFVASVGADYVGRYEILFSKLRESLSDWSNEIKSLLQFSDVKEQSGRVSLDTKLGRALDEAFAEVMALPNLVTLFGQSATQNAAEDFATHFARRTRHLFATLPAASNPYLWQVLAGEYPPHALPPWLTATLQNRLPETIFTKALMCDALKEARNEYDFVHLSNILDWLTPDEAAQTLDYAWRALRPSGCILIRQLNSTLAIQSLGQQFDWQREVAAKLHAGDRSFFYRNLHLGLKR